jgi:hypothetical protein
MSKDADSSEAKKRRFDDTEYLEQSQEIVDNVKNAVTTGMLATYLSDDLKTNGRLSVAQEEKEG